MISSLTCKNFRNIDVDNLTFKRINILIGPNNSGKTNFLHALAFCSDMLKRGNGNASSSFLNEVAYNGWQKVLNRVAGDDGSIRFQWGLSVNNRELDYVFQFHAGRQQPDFYITSEKLESRGVSIKYNRPFNFFDCHTKTLGSGIISTAKNKGEQNTRVRFQVSNQDTVMMQFQKILLENGELYNTPGFRKDGMTIVEDLTAYFRKFFSYSSAYFDLAAIRKPSDSRIRGDVLFENGSNFVNVLNQRFSLNGYLRKEMEEKIRCIMPKFDEMNISVISEQCKLQLALQGNFYDMDEVSDGTIKVLLLIALLFVPNPDTIQKNSPEFSLLTLDEPETNLHPAWQKWVSRWIMESANFEQCFVSTHSPELLDGFTEGFRRGEVAILVFDPRQSMLIHNLEYEEIKSDLGEWELGDLYRTNEPVIGGWPW